MKNQTEISLLLRPTLESDLEALFDCQYDEEAVNMAAFVPDYWNNKDVYITTWAARLTSGSNIHTIIVDEEIAGSIFTWDLSGELQISYWIHKRFWNKGVTTSALRKFLKMLSTRPLFGRTAYDNIGSMNVLTKCGFNKIGADKYYSNARKKEIDELIFRLD